MIVESQRRERYAMSVLKGVMKNKEKAVGER